MKKLMEELMAMRRSETEVIIMTQSGSRWQDSSSLSRFFRKPSMLKNS
jgi:hypothetical protein